MATAKVSILLFFIAITGSCSANRNSSIESSAVEKVSSNDSTKKIRSNDDPKCYIITNITRSHGQIQSVNFPHPYYTNCEWTYIVNVGNGYNMKIQIEHLDIDQNSGDRFYIEPGCTGNYSNKHSTEKTNSTAYQMNSICSTTKFKFNAEKHNNTKHTGFSLTYSRYGEDPSNSSYYIQRVPGWVQLYLQGVTKEEFNLKSDYFKLGVQKAAINYLLKSNIEVPSSKLFNTILINSVIGCPRKWIWSAKCIQVNFSIPIDRSLLTNKQLRDISTSEFFLGEIAKLGISEYDVPNYVGIMWFWIALLGAVIFVFFLIVLILTKTKLIGLYFQRIDTAFRDITYQDCLDIQENFAKQIFSAENAQKFKFIKDYDKEYWARENKQCPSVQKSPSMSVIMEEVDDFDSDNEDGSTTVYTSPHLSDSGFSKINTCYHMYSEPQIASDTSTTLKYEPISVIKL